MNAKQSNEMTSIRKKLMAAVAMLLVACIMTVSSTYAWFTLSTAPEVKGITTNVGANGNLEIALGQYNTVYGNDVPGAGEGTSMNKAGVTAQMANITWGNLIDLSTGYGLDLVTLYPTRLNCAEDGGIINTFPLKYASYGADGRVVDLQQATKGGYKNNGFMYDAANPSAGVSAIGSASNISERALALMNYQNSYVGNASAALKRANNSISKYGSELASLMVQHINAGDNDTNTYGNYKDELQGLITELQAANDYVGKTLKSAILAYLASDAAKLSEGARLEDAGWKTFNDAYADKTIEEIMANISAYQTNDTIQEYYNKTYVKVKETLEAAKTKADALTDTAKWEDVSDVVNSLVDSSNITVCEMTISEIKSNPNTVLQAIAKGGLTVEIGYTKPVEDSEGNITKVYVYSQLADMIGRIAGGVVFKEGTQVSAPGLSTPVDLSGFPATLYAYPSDLVQAGASAEQKLNGGMLNILESTIVGYKAPQSDSTEQGLTDTYGYTLDLLFRTNATDSNLLLQTDAANRIYSDNANADLMGGGSYMSFTASADFSATKIKDLMKAVRVVFYETPTTAGANGEILAVAGLDADNYSQSGNDVKADLVLVNATFTNGVYSSTGFKDDQVITALSANTVKKISVLVYLDGDVVTNEHVSALSSVNGKLNLQFASSAALKPMNNSALINGGNSNN